MLFNHNLSFHHDILNKLSLARMLFESEI